MQKKLTKKLISLLLTFMVLVTMTSFNTKEKSKLDVNLKDDFYTAINKDWLANAKIKDGQLSVSTFSETSDKIDIQKKLLIQDLVKKKENLKNDSTERKIVDLYESYLDVEGRNASGIKPIEGYLSSVKSIQTIDDLNKFTSDSNLRIFNELFQFGVGEDLKYPGSYITYIVSSSLHLGDSDDYTNPTELSKSNKNHINEYIENLLTLSGYSKEEANKKIDNMLKLENMLAPSIIGQKEASTTPNIFESMYNIYTLEELDKIAPNIKLSNTIKSLGYDKSKKFLLPEPNWLKKLNEIYTEENLPLIKDYLEISVIQGSAGALSEDFTKASENLSQKLYGIKGILSNEEKALQLVDSFFYDAIGRIYVENNFTSRDKLEVEVLIKQITNSYRKMINKTNVMSGSTKEMALKKLDTLKVEVGYPDKWKDYDSMKIKSIKDGGTLLENLLNHSYALIEENKENLTKPNTNPWSGLAAHTVNAFYNSQKNTIFFPAGILQKPFYDKNNSYEENLGGIGIIIAHEISHAFDTSGSKFDENGKLANWWSESDLKKFEENSKKIRDFYSKIEYLPSYFVNGDLTIGENIADIGAVQCTLNILKESRNVDYKKFFETWPVTFRTSTTKEGEIQFLNLDTHSPVKVRINAAFQQFDEFYKTYGIKEGDGMYVKPDNRIKIW